MSKRRQWKLFGLVLTVCFIGSARAQNLGLQGEVQGEGKGVLEGALCTLRGPMLPDEGLSTAAGPGGKFAFQGLWPGTFSLACTANGFRPIGKEGLTVQPGETGPFIQLVLPPETRLRQQVEVRAPAGQIATQTVTQSSTLTENQLVTLPIAQLQFKAALPLVPGVVRTPDGKLHIKGVPETQGLLLVDSADFVDPVTGSFSIEVPLQAIQSIQVYKSPYSVEYGRFSGGLTSVLTKPPQDQWNWELVDLVPDPRFEAGHLVGIMDTSPRLYLTGPLVPRKLDFSETFMYDMVKQPVRGLAWPNNVSKHEGFTSFTDFHLVVSSRHLISTSFKLFPFKHEWANISALVPQSASSNEGHNGYALAVTDRYLLSSGATLTSLFQQMQFNTNAYGQGTETMQVTPDGWAGNFFDTYRRRANQQEVIETYALPKKTWHGQHEVTVGADYFRRAYSGRDSLHPVLVTDPSGAPVEQINFSGPAALSAIDIEAEAFGQEHWVASSQMALDAGLRYSEESAGSRTAFAPRGGIVYSPGGLGKTIVRVGAGVFYDRNPLLALSFAENPFRTVSFAPGVNPTGTLAFPNACLQGVRPATTALPAVLPAGRSDPSCRFGTTPQNLSWSAEVDQELRPKVFLRLNYLGSQTSNQFIVSPQFSSQQGPEFALVNSGRSRYEEFESTLRVRPTESADVNISYVRSLARGDLNTLDQLNVPLAQPIIQPNAFGNLPSNILDRLVTWATIPLPWKITFSPLVDLHSGFPYSVVDLIQNYVGQPNSLRFPTFFSLDVKLTKEFHVPLIPLPFLKKHLFRGAFAIYNVTDHSNPLNVINNTSSPIFGHLLGFQHIAFDTFFDVID